MAHATAHADETADEYDDIYDIPPVASGDAAAELREQARRLYETNHDDHAVHRSFLETNFVHGSSLATEHRARQEHAAAAARGQRMPEQKLNEQPSIEQTRWQEQQPQPAGVQQWTSSAVARFVRGLTEDFGEKTQVYAEIMIREDISGNVLSGLNAGDLREMGLTLGHGFKLLRRIKEMETTGQLHCEQPRCVAGEGVAVEPHLEAVRIPIPKDNHCLFSSIAYLCCDGVQGESVARSLRKNIAECIMRDGIENDPPKYTNVQLGRPPSEYCEWIKDDTTWGGENEILILCEHFNVEVTVIVMGDNVTGITYGETYDTPRVGRIFLLYSGQHYDALVGRERERRGGTVSPSIRKMFPAGVSEMCSLALACGVTESERSRNGDDEQTLNLEMLSLLQTQGNERRMQQPARAPWKLQSLHQITHHSDDTRMQYLKKCQSGVSADLQSMESSIASTSSMSQETQNMILSLKLAQQLTEAELAKVQDSSAMPVFDPDATAGLGLTFNSCNSSNLAFGNRFTGLLKTKPCISVGQIREISAANFARVMPGDVLLQIDDHLVSDLDDVKRCLGPYGSVVHLQFGRENMHEGRPGFWWVSLFREVQASRRADIDWQVAEVSGKSATSMKKNYLVKSPDKALNPAFLQEAIDLVKSGDTLEMRSGKTWKRVTVKMTSGAYLVVDRQIHGTGAAYATLPPDAAADLSELRILSLQRQQQHDTTTFHVYVKSGQTCYAYSQRGLFEVEISMARLEFRAADTRETNLWVRGINAVTSQFGLGTTRPSRTESYRFAGYELQEEAELRRAQEHEQARRQLQQEAELRREQEQEQARRQVRQQGVHMHDKVRVLKDELNRFYSIFAPECTSYAENLARNHAFKDNLVQLNHFLKQQYGYHLDDLNRLELEATAAPVVQSRSHSALEEMGYTHAQIATARQALGRMWGVPESHVHDDNAIMEWLIGCPAEPQATLGFVHS